MFRSFKQVQFKGLLRSMIFEPIGVNILSFFIDLLCFNPKVYLALFMLTENWIDNSFELEATKLFFDYNKIYIIVTGEHVVTIEYFEF